MTDELLAHIARMDTGDYFVTAVTDRSGSTSPVPGVDAFIYRKLALIESGCSGRKFVYQDGGWRITVTFFPRKSVVDERYALKNKVQFLHRKTHG